MQAMKTRQVRVIKQNDPFSDGERMPDDLYRLANSMRRVLVRRYPDPEQRQTVASELMMRVRGQSEII